MQSLSLSVALWPCLLPSVFCLWNGTFCGFVVWWVDHYFFVAPSLAVFNTASVFNQNVSTWNTGAVTSMYGSKCKISLLFVLPPPPYLCIPCTRLPLLGFLILRQLEFCLFTILTRSVMLFVVGWRLVFLFFVAPSLLQCFIKHLCSIRTCPHGIRGW